MIKVHVRPNGDDNPLAGFEAAGDTMGQIYLLQVKTGNTVLDNALYRRCQGGSFSEVARALDTMRDDTPLGQKAKQLADNLRTEHNIEA